MLCNKTFSKKIKLLNLFVILVFFLCLFLINIKKKDYFDYKITNQEKKLILKSKCNCVDNPNRQLEISLNEKKNSYTIKSFLNKQNLEFTNEIPFHNFGTFNFTCDLYNTFKRPHYKNKKIVGFSLYGKLERYYKDLKKIVKQIKQFYPDWIVRVYHDDSINIQSKCEIECLTDENNNLLKNTDFCDITNLPISNSFFENKTWNAKYIHAKIWRWLPLGDSFVDTFISRDSDSFIMQRELDSVNMWLNSNKSAHIMRGLCLILFVF
jgi:hypothetical protein